MELAYYGGLSQSEIAERTHLPLGTVKTRVRLALRKLLRLARDAEGARAMTGPVMNHADAWDALSAAALDALDASRGGDARGTSPRLPRLLRRAGTRCARRPRP